MTTYKMPKKVTVENAKKVGEEISNLEEGDTITLDFSDLVIICSAGLGQLLKIQQKVKIIIVNITSDYIKKMFKMFKLNKIFIMEG